MSSSPRSPRKSTESFEFLSPNIQQSQYPFPQHDWTNRPNSTGGRYQPRRGSTASSIHSAASLFVTVTKVEAKKTPVTPRTAKSRAASGIWFIRRIEDLSEHRHSGMVR